MITSWMQLIIFMLAAFRITRLFVYDKITDRLRSPFIEEFEEEVNGELEIFIRSRGIGLRAFVGELLGCYWCTGLWVTIFLYGGWYFYPVFVEPVLMIAAIAGGAAILEAFVQKLID